MHPIRSFAGLVAAMTIAGPCLARDVADAVYLNGKVFTADAASHVVEAFAVRDGKFLAAGTSSAMRAYVGPATQVVDLKKRFVSPGLADAHFHNEGGGSGMDLSHVRSLAELFEVVGKAAAGATPDTILVANMDWHEAQLKEQRLPTARELDGVAPRVPVVLMRGGHSYILNSVALARWNITPDTPVPEGGAISRDQTGALTGELFDTAKALVKLPPPKPLSIDDVLQTQRTMNAYGVTSVRIPGFYKGAPGEMQKLYAFIRQARDSGQLALRYVLYMPGFGLRSADQVKQAIEQWGVRQDEGDDWVRIGGVKLGVDGGFEGGHLSKPYQEPYGKGGTYTGVTTSPPPVFTEVVKTLNQLGWRATTHAVGDAAVAQVLDAYEAADKEQPIAAKRWAIEHAFVTNHDQLRRLKKLNVALSAQDHLYLVAPVLKKYWGWETAKNVTPMKDYLDAGLLVVGGTDTPVIPFNPFWELYHFMSRDTISDGIYGSDQKIASRPLLLKLVTINYARLIGEEKQKGSIEPGKLADFAVLSDDFLTVPAAQMPSMKALATFVGGKEVYRDPAF
jgi:predicted amidohydrolase YtcJ